MKEILIQKTEKSIDFAFRSLHHSLTASSLLLEAMKEASESTSFQEKTFAVKQSLTKIKDSLLDWKSFMSTISNLSDVFFFFFFYIIFFFIFFLFNFFYFNLF